MNNEKNISKSRVLQEDEIDLISLVKVVWSKKWFISKLTGIVVVLGLIIAFTTPEEYKTSASLIPEALGEQSSKLGGSLGGLASLAGVDLNGLNGGAQIINPALYQSISRSTPFLLDLMNQEYFFGEVGDTLSLYQYLLEYQKSSLLNKVISIPKKLIGWVKGSSQKDTLNSTSLEKFEILILNKNELSILSNLRSRVFVEMDWDLKILVIEVEMQDPVVAARMVDFTKDYITKYISNYATSKGKQQLSSLEKQYKNRKREFEDIQVKLATFRDKNRNVTTSRAKSEEERLKSEYSLAFNIYNQLAQQKEAIKLRIEEDTPAFTILEPTKVPIERETPKRAVILVITFFVGFTISLGVIFVRHFLNQID